LLFLLSYDSAGVNDMDSNDCISFVRGDGGVGEEEVVEEEEVH
jgi:hypothetical protein